MRSYSEAFRKSVTTSAVIVLLFIFAIVAETVSSASPETDSVFNNNDVVHVLNADRTGTATVGLLKEFFPYGINEKVEPLGHVQQAKLTAADGAAYDQFGISVSLDGDTAVVGANGDDYVRGAAYVFTRSGTTWTQQARLIAPDSAINDNFGVSVSVSGDTVIVGADRHNNGRGAAYIFRRSGSIWTLRAKLLASDAAANDQFGLSVAIHGDTAVIGAPADDSEFGSNTDQGSAYVFTRFGDSWLQEVKLTASDGSAGDLLGFNVSLSGDTAMLGAVGDNIGTNLDQGSAYVFSRSETGWVRQAKLEAFDGAAGDSFGRGVSISGDTAVIGANGDDIGTNSNQGSAYIFTRSGTAWTSQSKIIAADGSANDQFGRSVSVSVNTVVVAATYDYVGANYNQGSAYLFTRSDSGWSPQEKLLASDGLNGDLFGQSVSVQQGTAVVGAIYDDVGAKLDQGSAYIYFDSAAPPCEYSITPESTTIPANGGSLSVAVTTQTGCPWAVSSDAWWIVVSAVGSASGEGIGVLNFVPNSGEARTGTVTIAGKTLTINQQAAAGSVAGTVRYYYGPSPPAVPGVTLTAIGEREVSASTGVTGSYLLENLGAGSYSTTATKTGQVSGISSLDASRVAQFAAGLVTLTANQQVAADASGNGSVSSLDASRIAQFVAGLGIGGNATGTWKFSPPSRSYESVASPLTGQDFEAILVGDVTGNWTPPSSLSENLLQSVTASLSSHPLDISAHTKALIEGIEGEATPPVAEPVRVKLEEATGASGQIIEVRIASADLTNRGLLAYDFEVAFDPLAREPIGALQTATLSADMTVTANLANSGRLRISAYGITPLAGEGILLRLIFRSLSNERPSKLRWKNLLFNEDKNLAIPEEGARNEKLPQLRR